MIRFRYQPTFADWFAFNRIVVLRQLRLLIWLAAVLLGLFLIYPFILRADGRDEAGVLSVYGNSLGVLFVPGVTCFVLIATYRGVRQRWQKAEEIREARDYEIDDQGVRVTGESLSGFIQWRHFTQAGVRRGYFILKTAQNQYHYFPVSIVPDQAALTALLATQVKSK